MRVSKGAKFSSTVSHPEWAIYICFCALERPQAFGEGHFIGQHNISHGIYNLLAYGWPYRGIPIQHWINNRFFQAYALCGFNEVP